MAMARARKTAREWVTSRSSAFFSAARRWILTSTATDGESQNLVAVMSAMTAQTPGAKPAASSSLTCSALVCRARLACARPPALSDVLHHPRVYPRRDAAAPRLALREPAATACLRGGTRVCGLPRPPSPRACYKEPTRALVPLQAPRPTVATGIVRHSFALQHFALRHPRPQAAPPRPAIVDHRGDSISTRKPPKKAKTIIAHLLYLLFTFWPSYRWASGHA